MLQGALAPSRANSARSRAPTTQEARLLSRSECSRFGVPFGSRMKAQESVNAMEAPYQPATSARRMTDELADKNRTLAEKDRPLADLHTKVKNLEKQNDELAEKNRALAEKDRALADLNKKVKNLEKQNSELVDKNRTFAEKDRPLADLHTKVKNLEKKNDELAEKNRALMEQNNGLLQLMRPPPTPTLSQQLSFEVLQDVRNVVPDSICINGAAAHSCVDNGGEKPLDYHESGVEDEGSNADARIKLQKKAACVQSSDLFERMIAKTIASESHMTESDVLMQQNQDLRSALLNLRAKLHLIPQPVSSHAGSKSSEEDGTTTLSVNLCRFIRAVYKVMSQQSCQPEADVVRKQNLHFRMSLFSLRVRLEVAQRRVQVSALHSGHGKKGLSMIGPVFQESENPQPLSGQEFCQSVGREFQLCLPENILAENEAELKSYVLYTSAVVCKVDQSAVQLQSVGKGPNGKRAATIFITSVDVTDDMIGRIEQALGSLPKAWWPPSIGIGEGSAPFYLREAYGLKFGGLLNNIHFVLAPSDPRQKFLQRTKIQTQSEKPTCKSTIVDRSSPVIASKEATPREKPSTAQKPGILLHPAKKSAGESVSDPSNFAKEERTGIASAYSKAELDDLLSTTSVTSRCDLDELADRIQRTKTCTVFLSSVFNGMEEERKLMMEKHRPRLEEECAKRGVALIFVDMRLGITDEMGKKNLTVLTCIRAVEESDIFVGYYASKGRYGWHGDSLQPSLEACATEFPWIVDRYRDRSVTEIEWLAGGAVDEMKPGKGPTSSLWMYRDGTFDDGKAKNAEDRLAALVKHRAHELSDTEKKEARNCAEKVSMWREESDCPYWRDDDKNPLPLLRWTLPEAEYEERKQKVAAWVDGVDGLRKRKQGLEALVRKRVQEGKGLLVMGYPQPARGAQIQHDFILRVFTEVFRKLKTVTSRRVADEIWEAQKAFAYSRTKIVMQSSVFEEVKISLEKWAGKPITISGVSGGGKSTLAARLVMQSKEEETPGGRKQRATEVSGAEPDLEGGSASRKKTFAERAQTVFWFVGCNAGSTQLSEMLFYVTWKLRDIALESGQLLESHRHLAGSGQVQEMWQGSSDSEADKRARVENEFAEIVGLWGKEEAWNEQGAPEVLLLFDALNQLRNEPTTKNEEQPYLPHSLYWLPERWPERLRVVITTLSACREYQSGQVAEVLRMRRYIMMETKVLEIKEKEELVRKYFKMNFKTPTDDLVQQVSKSKQTENPMFLTMLLQEIICHGTYGDINEWLSELLGAGDVPGLLQRMLGRLVEVFNEEIPDLVGKCLRVIWASREGVTEREMLGILNMQRGVDSSGRVGPEVLYTKHWLPLRFAMQRLVQPRAGLWNFSHDFVRQAVERLFLVRQAMTEIGAIEHKDEHGAQSQSYLVEDCLHGKNEALARNLDHKIRVQHAIMAAFYQSQSQEVAPSYSEEQPRAVREMVYHQRRAGLSPVVTVAVRLRPFSKEERVKEDDRDQFSSEYYDIDRSIVRMEGCQTVVHPYAAMGQPGNGMTRFNFDHSMSSLGECRSKGQVVKLQFGQEDVFKKLGVEAIDQVLEGYDSTVLAYGQTGSGKTYTMFGNERHPAEGETGTIQEGDGLIPRLCDKLMRNLMMMEKNEELASHVTLSVIEIYCEQVRDLLSESNTRPSGGLRVLSKNRLMEDGEVVPETFVEGVTLSTFSSIQEMKGKLKKAFTQRATEHTEMNDTSSRSHCLAMLTVGLLRLRSAEDSADSNSLAEELAIGSTGGIPKGWMPPEGVDEFEIIDPSSTSPNQVIRDFGGFLGTEQETDRPLLSILHFRNKNAMAKDNTKDTMEGDARSPNKGACTEADPLKDAWIEIDLGGCSGPAERASVLHGLKVGKDVMLTWLESGPSLVCPPRVAKLISRIGFPSAQGTWTAAQVKESLGAVTCDTLAEQLVAVQPTESVDPSPTYWIPAISGNEYDVLPSPSSKSSDTWYTARRKMVGGPLDKSWIELDLESCSTRSERTALLRGVEAGKLILLTSSFSDSSRGPSLVCPPRVAKLISRIGFPSAPDTWTADQVKESLGAEQALELKHDELGKELVVVRPTKCWSVGGMRESRLNLVDLAGSERVNKSGAVKDPKRLAEATSINKSLSILCSVIGMLSVAGSQGKQIQHVPFRDSKLTRLLQSSLDGTSKIILIGTVSPFDGHTVETIDTLRYAQKAKKIVSRASRRAEEGLLRDILKTTKALGTSINVHWNSVEGKFRAFPEGETTISSGKAWDSTKIAQDVFKSYDWWCGRQTDSEAGIGWRHSRGSKAWLEWDAGAGSKVDLASYSIGAGNGVGETFLEGPWGWKLFGNNEEEPTGQAGEEEQEDWILLDEQTGVDWTNYGTSLCTFDVPETSVEGGRGFRRFRWCFLVPPAGTTSSNSAACWVRSIRLRTVDSKDVLGLTQLQVEKDLITGFRNLVALALTTNISFAAAEAAKEIVAKNPGTHGEAEEEKEEEMAFEVD